MTPVGDRNQAVASWRVLKLPVKAVGALRPAPGTAIGGAAVTDDTMLGVALHLRGQEMSLRDIGARLVIATGKKRRKASTRHRRP